MKKSELIKTFVEKIGEEFYEGYGYGNFKRVKSLDGNTGYKYVFYYSDYFYEFYLGVGYTPEIAFKNKKRICNCYEFIFPFIRDGLKKLEEVNIKDFI